MMAVLQENPPPLGIGLGDRATDLRSENDVLVSGDNEHLPAECATLDREILWRDFSHPCGREEVREYVLREFAEEIRRFAFALAVMLQVVSSELVPTHLNRGPGGCGQQESRERKVVLRSQQIL